MAYERDIEAISQNLHSKQIGHPSMLYLELSQVKNGTFVLLKNKYGGSENHYFIREIDTAVAAMKLAARGHNVKIVP